MYSLPRSRAPVFPKSRALPYSMKILPRESAPARKMARFVKAADVETLAKWDF